MSNINVQKLICLAGCYLNTLLQVERLFGQLPYFIEYDLDDSSEVQDALSMVIDDYKDTEIVDIIELQKLLDYAKYFIHDARLSAIEACKQMNLSLAEIYDHFGSSGLNNPVSMNDINAIFDQLSEIISHYNKVTNQISLTVEHGLVPLVEINVEAKPLKAKNVIPLTIISKT